MAPDGRRFEIESARPAAGASPDMLVARLKGISDRSAAEALNGIELAVPRDRLPEADAGEYYYADLIGLDAVTVAGASLGTVVAVRNFGAGDLLEIAPERGDTILVPFTQEIVPDVDQQAGRVVVDPPPGLIGQGGVE
jgi:16S rRNA processing protein RimM